MITNFIRAMLVAVQLFTENKCKKYIMASYAVLFVMGMLYRGDVFNMWRFVAGEILFHSYITKEISLHKFMHNNLFQTFEDV